MPLSGSEEFISDLLNLSFQSPPNAYDVFAGCEINGHALFSTGFRKPILIPKKDGLRIKVPTSFFPHQLLSLIDPETVVDVIDVRAQEEIQMHLKDLISHFERAPRVRLLNLLSLEFSQTKLSELVEPPHVVNELSLISNSWISDNEEESGCCNVPSVQKYCLLSMRGSYTDFHVDFGGSSVWYHVLWGEKIFYLIPPSSQNLSLYWTWIQSPNHRSTFFPNLLQECPCVSDSKVSNVIELHVSTGQTILLPSGWIHAVYTVSDCLVFGGNFLTELHIPMQLSIYKMEERCNTPRKFQFPNFEKVHWFAADRLVGKLTNMVHDKRTPAAHEIEAVYSLVRFLPEWLDRRCSLPPDERAYYLPNPSAVDLPFVQLLEQLRVLMRVFIPSTNRKSKFPEADARTKKSNSKTTVSEPKPEVPSVSRESLQIPCFPVGDLSKPKRRVRSSHKTISKPASAVTEDSEVIEALPELNDSVLVGDHYYLLLSDSDEDPGGVSASGAGRNQSKKAGTPRRARDPDPTWTVSASTHSKNRTPLSSPQLASTNRLAIHPLLRDPGRSNEKRSKDHSSTGNSSSSKTDFPEGSHKKQSSSTVRQRLAKRLRL